ncbi:MAG: YbhB/YbcL family Raf kinase inhibitor-like protein [Candidatus Helarchaeota archaeon]
MRLKSAAFEHEGLIPMKYTCEGSDISPPLSWNQVPEGTKSFALIVDDPDAPVGTWVHWLVCDIPPDTREIPQNTIPDKATLMTNDFGKKKYGGPCPPSGTHRYFFKLYALDVQKLNASDKRQFYEEVEKHKIAEAILMGKYKKLGPFASR